MWACFCCLLARFPPQHQKRVHVDAFLVLGDYRLLEHQKHAHVSVSLVFAGSPSTPTPKTRPCGRVFGVGCLPFTPTRETRLFRRVFRVLLLLSPFPLLQNPKTHRKAVSLVFPSISLTRHDVHAHSGMFFVSCCVLHFCNSYFFHFRYHPFLVITLI